MKLPGRLRLTTLGDVLGTVYREGATGVLELTESHGARGSAVHRIHVLAGLVAHVETGLPTPKLGELLHRIGLLGDQTFREIGHRMSPGRPGRLGERLVADGTVTEADVLRALRLQRRESLERLFLLEDAQITFRVAREKSREAGAPFQAMEYLAGKARSRDRGAAAGPAKRRDPVRARALSTLGLLEGADKTVVQRAFRQLASTLHPDRFPTATPQERADLMRKFAEITAAYHTLVA